MPASLPTQRSLADTACKRAPYHPMELIPGFSRWPPSLFRDIVYTALFNTLMGVVFVVLNLLFSDGFSVREALDGGFLVRQFVIAQCIGFTIYVLIRAMDTLLPGGGGRTRLGRAITFVITPIVGAFVGYWLATYVLGLSQPREVLLTRRGVASVLTVAGFITLVLVSIFIPRERAARAEARAALDEARVSAAERAATIARMQLLEAQVEPHFLYNTLAHVMSLVDAEPALAKRMLHRLIDLLRATAVAGEQTSTVRSQTALLHDYLDLIALRMGPRLAWSIEVDPALADCEIAPMLLQPVVENAIKHGLEPGIDGGRVDVRVTRRGEGMTLTVADTGLGVAPTRDVHSTGLGLPNLRARLAAVYGDSASLRLSDNVPRGTVVTIELPLPAAAAPRISQAA